MADLILFGVSNMLSDLFDTAIALGHQVRAVVENQPEEMRPRSRTVASRLDTITPRPERLALADFRPRSGEIYALGTQNPERRALVAELQARFGIEMTGLIHPAAQVSPQARLGTGVYLNPGAMVGPGVVLEDHVCVYRAAVVGHDSHIGAYSRVGVGSRIAGLTRIGEGCTIFTGAIIGHELVIGDQVTVAAGAVVVRDVPDGVTVAGVPAKVIRMATA